MRCYTRRALRERRSGASWSEVSKRSRGCKNAQPSVDERVNTDMVAIAALEYDAGLMLRVKEGDSASFALLLEKYRVPVVHFLFRMVQNYAISEELGQEVFLRVYRSRATYEPAAKFTTWLFRI